LGTAEPAVPACADVSRVAGLAVLDVLAAECQARGGTNHARNDVAVYVDQLPHNPGHIAVDGDESRESRDRSGEFVGSFVGPEKSDSPRHGERFGARLAARPGVASYVGLSE